MKGEPAPGTPINHRQLEAFQATVELGSATAAAEALRITQPAVSRLIASLERDVGFELFERHRKGLRPTADGRLLYDEVALSYRGLHRVRATAEAIRSQQRGRVRVVALAAYAEGFVAKAAGDYMRQHAGVRIELETAGKVDVVDGVLAGQCDIGVCTLPVDAPGLKSVRIGDGTAVCIAPAEHRFASVEAVGVADLGEQPMVVLGVDNPFRRIVQSRLEDHGVRPQVVAEVETQRAIRRMVAAGAGVAIVDSLVAYEPGQEQLCVRRLVPRTNWTIAAVVARRKKLSTAGSGLLAQLHEFYALARAEDPTASA